MRSDRLFCSSPIQTFSSDSHELSRVKWPWEHHPIGPHPIRPIKLAQLNGARALGSARGRRTTCAVTTELRRIYRARFKSKLFGICPKWGLSRSSRCDG